MGVSGELIEGGFSIGVILQTLTAFCLTVLVVRLYIAWRSFASLREVVEKLPGLSRRFIIGNVWEARIAFISRTNFPNNVFLLLMITALGFGFGEDGMAKVWLLFRPCVILLRANTVEPLMSSTVALTKSFEYKFLKGWLGTGLLTSTGKKWKTRRKMLTPSFHFRILEEFQPIISEQSQVLIQKIKKLPGLYCPDIMERITLCALDIIGETALGVQISSQDNGNTTYVKALSVIGRVAMLRVLRPWLWNDFIFNLTPTGREAKKSLKTLHDFTKKVIRERKANYKASTDTRRLAFLDLLLQEHFKDSSFTEDDIQEEVDTFTFEGHDTTATGMSWCLYLLGLNTDIQEKVYQEMVDIFGKEKGTPIEIEHLKEMKYLEMVIKEALRIYPPVPLIARELTEDLVIEKHLIPASTTCFVCVPELHRDPQYFPNPDVFDPDRFLPENSSGRHPFAYIPFSAGPRNCIGQKFAMNEEKTLVANVIRNFKLKSLDHRDKVMVCPELVSRPFPYLRMQFELRD